MDFASVLSDLAIVHDNECNRRKVAETNLEAVKKELLRLKIRLGDYGSEADFKSKGSTDDEDNLSFKAASEEPVIRSSMLDGEEPHHPPRIRATVRYKDTDHHVDELAMMKGWKDYEPERNENQQKSSSSMRSSLQSISAFRKRIKDIVADSLKFDGMIALAIFANSLLVGAVVDHAAQHDLRMEDMPGEFRLAERCFTILFSFELSLRVFAGFDYFFRSEHKYWNFFDLLVVGGDILQFILETVNTVGSSAVVFTMFRAMRFMRVTRAIRVVRLVRFFKELRMMVYSIMRCGTSLLWSILLFVIIFYIFGVFLMTQVLEHLGTHGQDSRKATELKHFFGSVPQTMLILYACMSGGISWTEVSEALGAIHWINPLALAFFVFFSLFVVANILTGIFVETAIQSAQSDREEIIQEQMASQESELMILKAIFQEADEDGSGEISEDEFQSHLAEDKVRAHLTFLGIHVNEAMGLFKLLDQDESGHIGIDEFVMGCMRLKGGAKGIDLATMMYESKKLVEHINRLDAFCEEQFDQLQKTNVAILHSIKLYRTLDNPRAKTLSSLDTAPKQTDGEHAAEKEPISCEKPLCRDRKHTMKSNRTRNTLRAKIVSSSDDEFETETEPSLCEVPPSRAWNGDLFRTNL